MKKDQFLVQESRLIDSKKNIFLKKIFSRLIANLLLTLSELVIHVYKNKTNKKLCQEKKFVFIGRFESDNWIAAHIKPLAESKVCSHIWIVADQKMQPIKKVTYVIPSPILKKLFGSIFARSVVAYKITKNNNIDYVGGFHLLLNGIIANIIAKILNCRSIYFCVGGWSELIGGGVFSGSPIFKNIGRHDDKLEKRLLNSVLSVDLIITMGCKAKQYFEMNGVNNVVVNPGGIDPRVFYKHSNSNFSIKNKEIDLILVARLDPIKRIDRFLSIVKKLQVLLPNISCAIVGGGGKLGEYKNLTSQLGLDKNVKFVGATDDVASYLSKSRIFVLTSDSEGLPLSCMEATILGLPIVASDVGDLSDIVESGTNGYLFEKTNVKAFVDCLHSLLTDSKLEESISLSALSASKKFTMNHASMIWNKNLQ